MVFGSEIGLLKMFKLTFICMSMLLESFDFVIISDRLWKGTGILTRNEVGSSSVSFYLKNKTKHLLGSNLQPRFLGLCKAARLQGRKAARPQGRKAARPQGCKAARL